MNKTVFIHLYDHSVFFNKWLHHTKGTSVMAFTTNYKLAQKAFSYILKLVENVVLNIDGEVTVPKIKVDVTFMSKLTKLVTDHISRTDMNNYLLSIKLFRQCLVEMIDESGAKERNRIMMDVSKVFDVIELTISDIFHVFGLQKLKDFFLQMNEDAEDEKSSLPPTLIKLSKLTQSEYSICELIATNITSKEIAEKLNISVSTVHTHRKRIRKKLNIPTEQSLYSYLKYIL